LRETTTFAAKWLEGLLSDAPFASVNDGSLIDISFLDTAITAEAAVFDVSKKVDANTVGEIVWWRTSARIKTLVAVILIRNVHTISTILAAKAVGRITRAL